MLVDHRDCESKHEKSEVQRVDEWDHAQQVEFVLEAVLVEWRGVVLLAEVDLEQHKRLTLVNDASPDEKVQVFLCHGVQLLLKQAADVLGELEQQFLVVELLRGLRLLFVRDNNVILVAEALVEGS